MRYVLLTGLALLLFTLLDHTMLVDQANLCDRALTPCPTRLWIWEIEP